MSLRWGEANGNPEPTAGDPGGCHVVVVGMAEICDRDRSVGQWAPVGNVEGANKRAGGQGVRGSGPRG